jgi:hypothetical protein
MNIKFGYAESLVESIKDLDIAMMRGAVLNEDVSGLYREQITKKRELEAELAELAKEIWK